MDSVYSSDSRSSHYKLITRLGIDSSDYTKCSVKTRLGCTSVLLLESSLADRSGNKLQIEAVNAARKVNNYGRFFLPVRILAITKIFFLSLSLLGEVYFFQAKSVLLTY